MNKINIIGRITKDIELRQTKNEISVTHFSIAVKREIKDESGEYGTDFFNVVAWRKTAEFISNYFEKGSRIAISGKLQNNIYTDKDGVERTSTEIVAEEVDFIDKKKEKEEQVVEVEVPPVQEPMADQVFAEFGNSIDINDDDIAF